MVRTIDRRRAVALSVALLAGVSCRPGEHQVQLVEIQVTDLDRATGFYQAVFGWGASRPDSSYAILDASPIAIGLAKRDGVIPGGATVVVRAPDLEVILAQVIANGGEVRAQIGASWRGRQFTFSDPDGNQMVVWSEGDEPARD